MSNSLRPYGLQHARLPCPSLSLGICSNSHQLSRWCHPTISSSVTPFSSWVQSFPASGSFPKSWLFTSAGQGTGASTLAPVLPMNIQSLFSLGLTDLTSLQSKEFSRAFSSTTVWKHQFFGTQPSLWPSSHICTTTGKTITLTTQIFVRKLMSLLFNTLFVTAFLLKSKCLLISWPRMSCCELLAQLPKDGALFRETWASHPGLKPGEASLWVAG